MHIFILYIYLYECRFNMHIIIYNTNILKHNSAVDSINNYCDWWSYLISITYKISTILFHIYCIYMIYSIIYNIYRGDSWNKQRVDILNFVYTIYIKYMIQSSTTKRIFLYFFHIRIFDLKLNHIFWHIIFLFIYYIL